MHQSRFIYMHQSRFIPNLFGGLLIFLAFTSFAQNNFDNLEEQLQQPEPLVVLQQPLENETKDASQQQ